MDEIISELSALGFTEYESRVYLALLHENPATGYQVSKDSGVPRSMVYEALGRLATRGAVMRSESRRATLFRPVPPDVLLDRYLDEQASLVQNLRDNLRVVHDAGGEELLWSFHGRNAVLSYASQMLAEAEEEVLLVLSDDDLRDLHDPVISAHVRNVSLGSLLTGDADLEVGRVARHPPLESEIQGLTRMLVVVQDRRQALIASSGTAEDMTATVTTNLNLVLISHQFIWMELFAQRIYARLGSDLLSILDPEDRQILEVYSESPVKTRVNT